MFTEVKSNRIESAEVVDGVWYLVIRGDYTGRVSGTVYDLTIPSEPEIIDLEPKWDKCKLPTKAPDVNATIARTSSVRPSLMVSV